MEPTKTSGPLRPGPQERTGYSGNIVPVLEAAAGAFDLGRYEHHEVKQNGYEDFNSVLITDRGRTFIKCFAHWRKDEDCRRYMDIVSAAVDVAGVRAPRLFPLSDGEKVLTVDTGETPLRLCVMQYLDGGNLWESRKLVTFEEQMEIVRQAALVNRADFHPSFIEDSWAIVNLQNSYEANGANLPWECRDLIQPLLTELAASDTAALPHSLVHADIRSTNVMRHSDGGVYLIDFSVSNWYPRIVELAVLASEILFNPREPSTFDRTFTEALSVYQETAGQLAPEELRALPLFVRLAHAANVIGASSASALQYINQDENSWWLEVGMAGLEYTVKNWRPPENGTHGVESMR